MKFSSTLALAAAPLAMAIDLHDIFPRANHMAESNKHTVVAEQKYGGYNSETRTEIIIIWANPGANAPTTTLHEKVTVTQTVTAGADATKVVGGDGAVTHITEGQTATAPAAGASHTVTVGGPAGLVFVPDQLHNVPVGDFVVFEFLSQNHTVTQSPFDTPCDALADGMDTGFMANPNNTVSPPPQVAMQVMVSKPLWFYCKQGNHCGKGMVFSINPTADKTQAMFQQKAIEQKGDGKATPITGGKPDPNAPAQSPAASSSVVQPPPAATSAASAPEGTGITPGKGTIGADGSCTCFVACSAGGFPAQNAQGVGAFGGQAGGLPMNMGSMN